MDPELPDPDNVLLAGGEVVPLPWTTPNPFGFLCFMLQIQITIYEAMMQDYARVWRILWEPLLPTASNSEWN